ncbi:MAG TPA: hypothetical protein VMW80_14305 [Candidatus Dormibacteraeota bacterium]|nr:hypothetical protein [Candidatus Dormibacteraeota bacterium]
MRSLPRALNSLRSQPPRYRVGKVVSFSTITQAGFTYLDFGTAILVDVQLGDGAVVRNIPIAGMGFAASGNPGVQELLGQAVIVHRFGPNNFAIPLLMYKPPTP